MLTGGSAFSSGEGHSLQPSQQPGAATTEKTSPTNPTSPIRSPIQSPGYRLGGGDPEKVEPGTPTTNGGLSSPPPPVNATDPSEREKRLQAIAQREVCLKSCTCSNDILADDSYPSVLTAGQVGWQDCQVEGILG